MDGAELVTMAAGAAHLQLVAGSGWPQSILESKKTRMANLWFMVMKKWFWIVLPTNLKVFL